MAMQRIKLVMSTGDVAVGKTCLAIRYTTNTYPEDFVPSVYDSYNANVIVDGQFINLDIWDTAAGEDYDRLTQLSNTQTDVFLIVYSISSPASFSNVETKWYPKVKQHCPHAQIVLVATKKDLRTDSDIVARLQEKGQAPITYEQGAALAQKMGAFAFCEVSSKTGEGVKEAFETAIRAVIVPKEHKKKRNRRRTSLWNKTLRDLSTNCSLGLCSLSIGFVLMLGVFQCSSTFKFN
jgi:Ras-related C3 botulinum toxin substrate 1